MLKDPEKMGMRNSIIKMQGESTLENLKLVRTALANIQPTV